MYNEAVEENTQNIRLLAGVALAIALINAAALGAFFAYQFRQLTPVAVQTASPTPSLVAAPASPSSQLSFQAQLNELSEKVAALENQKPTSSTTVVKTESSVKETLLYMGTGRTTSRDWTTIDSAAVMLDTSFYGKIKEIRFEAALSILSGEVYARLINKDTGAIYYESQVSHNQSTSEWKTSSAVNLPRGKYNYAVQLRSSNNDEAKLDGARLKILVQ